MLPTTIYVKTIKAVHFQLLTIAQQTNNASSLCSPSTQTPQSASLKSNALKLDARTAPVDLDLKSVPLSGNALSRARMTGDACRALMSALYVQKEVLYDA